ncbi:hypothetical protein GE061_016490 [Apolygus lucorum]|uniref:Pyruvate dehydrogenase E1 component subunit alpha n=1 Tax=Apolygus lucorum TaxID=248454 RepID=A0A6A4JZ91_APOLU|nr:hypothetical protein GE061_016490 [Apolygus lucorum]
MLLARGTLVHTLGCLWKQLRKTAHFPTVTEIKKIEEFEVPFQGHNDEVSFEIKPFIKHKLETDPCTTVKLNREDGLKMYKQMNIIRKLELAAAQLYQDKKIRGFCHLYTGQEGVAVGIKSAMREQDTVISSYRAHGWHYLMSDSAVSLMSELTGKVTGCSRGKGGSMHLYAKNFFGGNGIVGAQVPLGTGIALYHKLQNTGGVSFTVYGDGAANQGQVFESFNMAKLWNLPVVFVCENNHYGMGTSEERSSADIEYYRRGDYIPGIKVDGMDVLAVRECAAFGIAHCLEGKGPIILEMDTYRYHGHSMSDPGTAYRTRDEVSLVRKNKDPITILKNRMVSTNLSSDEDFKTIDNEVKVLLEDVITKAKGDPEPTCDEFAIDIYQMNCQDSIRGCVPNEVFLSEETSLHERAIL